MSFGLKLHMDSEIIIIPPFPNQGEHVEQSTSSKNSGPVSFVFYPFNWMLLGVEEVAGRSNW